MSSLLRTLSYAYGSECFSALQERLRTLKTQERRDRFYEAYLWESWFDLPPDQLTSRSYTMNELSAHSVEGRLFEDPMYLMQYSVLWPDPYDRMAVCIENNAYLTAENELYLRKVKIAGTSIKRNKT